MIKCTPKPHCELGDLYLFVKQNSDKPIVFLLSQVWINRQLVKNREFVKQLLVYNNVLFGRRAVFI